MDGIPTLVVLSEQYKTITTKGVGAVSSDPEGADFPWHPKVGGRGGGYGNSS